MKTKLLRSENEAISARWVRRVMVSVIAVFFTGFAYGQTAEVAGTVTDSNTGEVLPGVNIAVEATTIGTTTNSEGRYQLQVPSSNDTLRFAFIGYESQSVPVNERTTIDVQLVASVISGSEVVVVGYGEQQRSSLTGSISSVSKEELNELPVGNVQQSLQGRVAGLTVRNNGGPGEDPVVQIRGISSISYATDPLYVIDGVP